MFLKPVLPCRVIQNNGIKIQKVRVIFMIQLMPFTYLSDRLIRRLASTIGPFGICGLGDALVPTHMRSWVRQEALAVLLPTGLNVDHVTAAIKELEQWGSLHEGHTAALASIFAANPSRSPLVDENAPTRIRSRIRRRDDGDSDRHAARLFQSALVLAVAQSYDEQQDAVINRLAIVDHMQSEMFARLTDEPSNAADIAGLHPGPDGPAADPEPGLAFVDKRIEAWACVASRLPSAAHLYLTTSAAVYDGVLERLPDAVRLGQWHIGTDSAVNFEATDRLTGQIGQVAKKPRWLSQIESLAEMEEPLGLSLDLDMNDQTAKGPAKLTLHLMPGLTPQVVLSRLAKDISTEHRMEARPVKGSGTGVRNTLFGYISFLPG
jgi:hypothetical protein